MTLLKQSTLLNPGLRVSDSSTTGPLIKAGLWIPKGSLDRFKAARAASGTTLCEVTIHGDSTTYGQVGANSPGSAGEYSWVQKLRSLSIAAGLTDGGVGLRGQQDSSNMSGTDAITPYTLGTGATTGTRNFHGAYGISIPAAGNTVTATGNTSKARIWFTRTSTAGGGGAFTFQTNGGTVLGPYSCVTTSSTAYDVSYRLVTGMTAGATNNIVITNTTAGGVDVVVEWINSTGMVYHKQGISGVLMSNEFNTQSFPNGFERIPPRFGLGIGAAVSPASYYSNAITKTAGVRTGLHIMQLGINDLLNATSAADGLTRSSLIASSIAMFARYAELAGSDAIICIPHYVMAGNPYILPYEGMYRQAMIAAAQSFSLPIVDLGYPLGGWANLGTYGSSVHMNQAGYDAQAQFLWDNVLSPSAVTP